MDIDDRTMKALMGLGRTLPDNSSIELCLLGESGRPVCHRFSVSEGVVHHRESHSSDFVKGGRGALCGEAGGEAGRDS